MNNQTVTPGWKTSEFWLTLLHQIPTVLAIFLGASNPAVIAVGVVGGLVSAIYTANRSGVKIAAMGGALVAPATTLAQGATDALNALADAAKTAAAATAAAPAVPAAPAAAPAVLKP
jgi:hypothetical protein